jgi:hypothetical protein
MDVELSQTKFKLIKVAHIIDDYTLIINKGSENGINIGQRFLVFIIGEEIIDPESKESLGYLEIVKGTGKITHLQPKMATLSSDMQSPPGRSIRKSNNQNSRPFDITKMLGGDMEVEEQLPPKPIAFKSPQVGDLVKKV